MLLRPHLEEASSWPSGRRNWIACPTAPEERLGLNAKPELIPKQTLLAALALMLVLGTTAGCGRNQAHLGRDGKPEPVVTSASGAANSPASTSGGRNASNGGKPSASAPDPTAEFQFVTREEVQALLADPKTNVGLYVFVDARNNEAFETGHLPQAIHCDYWHVGTRLNAVLPRILGAEKVIVYCQGKDCEVGPGLCRSLAQLAQIPRATIYLFKGGWEEWVAAKLPIETGREGKP